MSSIIRKCSDFSPFTKFGISGACTALGYAFVSTNPVALAALAVLPWVPNAMNRCCRRQQPAVVVQRGADRLDPDTEEAIRRSLQPGGEALNVAQAALTEAQQLEIAMALSRAELDDVKENKEGIALRRSLNPLEQVYVCPYGKALSGSDRADDDVIIPENLLLQKEDGAHCNLASFLITLLMNGVAPSAPESRDMLGRDINVGDIQIAALMLGIDCENFLQIWERAQVSQASVNQYYLANPEDQSDITEVMSGLKTDARIKLFKQMLQASGNPVCRNAIAFYNKNHAAIWNKD
ncbi:MAG: hypothetical protein K1X28_03950 [Parachlamydiales bacterium]|nr:hypothetical protein [Parachlamydiales bacterium]